MDEVKQYWVRNDDLKDERCRDNPREVVLSNDYVALETENGMLKGEVEALEKEMQEEIDAAWYEVLDSLQQAWPAKELVYSESTCELITQLINERNALEAQVRELREAAVKLVLPYEALLIDNESRRWLAPTLWAAIEEGVVAIRAALAEAQEGKEESRG